MAIRPRNPIKINPVDVKDKSAVGVRLPFGGKKSIFTLDYTTRDHVKSKLLNVLLTSPGERIKQPFFGAGLKNRLFEQQTETSEEELKNYIYDTYGQHYSTDKYQATDVIIDSGHGEGFCIGNIMKYAKRYGNKGGKNKKDLLKILHYGIIMLYIHDEEQNFLEGKDG